MMACTCPECGKPFIAYCGLNWMYRINNTYYCGYDCWMKAKRGKEPLKGDYPAQSGWVKENGIFRRGFEWNGKVMTVAQIACLEGLKSWRRLSVHLREGNTVADAIRLAREDETED